MRFTKQLGAIGVALLTGAPIATAADTVRQKADTRYVKDTTYVVSGFSPIQQDPLLSMKKLQCSFSTLATGTWVDGAPRAEVKTAKFAVRFDAIDVADGTADTVGQFGPLHITVRLLGTTLHFMHIDTSGALYVTTVFAPGRDKLSAGKLRAVHSRHEYTEVSLPGFTSRPEQYYGECEAN